MEGTKKESLQGHWKGVSYFENLRDFVADGQVELDLQVLADGFILGHFQIKHIDRDDQRPGGLKTASQRILRGIFEEDTGELYLRLVCDNVVQEELYAKLGEDGKTLKGEHGRFKVPGVAEVVELTKC